MICQMKDCSDTATRRKFCNKHYREKIKDGSLKRVRFVGMSIEDRLKKFVRLDEKTDCLVWTGSKTWSGYGICRITEKAIPIRMHRAAWEIKNGPIPEGMILCHTCDNPPCVNPDHLFLGTNKTNAIDRDLKNRQVKGEQHGQAKLKKEDVIKIINDKRPSAEIAKGFGVSISAIKDIKANRRWKSVQAQISVE